MSTFSFVDLFAGVGGFHAALAALGGECWFVSEIDRAAAAVYEANWLPAADRVDRKLQRVDGDIVPLTTDQMLVPPTDVLAAGFPCQPFSKSGAQKGMGETRGTLFWNICRVLEEHRPAAVMLENVRNLAGPRHAHEWVVIIEALRDLGYRVSSTPAVFSPHLLPPQLGGRPQARERVFITATQVGRARAMRETDLAPIVVPRPVAEWDPQSWNLEVDLPMQTDDEIEGGVDQYRLSDAEHYWVEVWEDLISHLVDQRDGERLPGFPIWADEFRPLADLVIPAGTPTWKADFLRKNARFYDRHADIIDAWLDRHDNLTALPPSRRKLEWQAQDTASLWETVMHFRPSGIRAKRASYVPALVAITQTSVVGSNVAVPSQGAEGGQKVGLDSRKLTPREAARLQGLPDWFEFAHEVDGVRVPQADKVSYRQMGNGVNVGAAYYVMRQHVLRDAEDIAARAPGLVEAVTAADSNPDVALAQLHHRSQHQVSEASPLPV